MCVCVWGGGGGGGGGGGFTIITLAVRRDRWHTLAVSRPVPQHLLSREVGSECTTVPRCDQQLLQESTHQLMSSSPPVSHFLKLGKKADHQARNSTLGNGGGGSHE